MRAVAVYPTRRVVKLIERPEPQIETPTAVKLRMLEVGVCGTDKELCAFTFGTPPAGSDHFILGHESLAQVHEAGTAVGDLRPGDLVVSSVRLPCPDPECLPCRTRQQDFCITGLNREHGIRGLDGFMADYVVVDRPFLHPLPASLRPVGVLVEPLTIAEKAFAEAVRIQQRLPWQPARRTAVVLGAGAVGLVGAMKFVAEGYRTFIYSLLPRPNPSSAIADAIGATYLSTQLLSVSGMAARTGPIDLVYEALGAAQVAIDTLHHLGPNGLFIFTGVPRAEHLAPFQTEKVITNLVLQNQAILGIVNSGPQAFADAIRDLTVFYMRWPKAVEGLITARHPLENFLDPVLGRCGGIKNVITLTA